MALPFKFYFLWFNFFNKYKLLLKLFFCMVVFTIVTVFMTMKSIFNNPSNNNCLYHSCSMESKHPNMVGSNIASINENIDLTIHYKKININETQNIEESNIKTKAAKIEFFNIKKFVLNQHEKQKLKKIENLNTSTSLNKHKFHNLTSKINDKIRNKENKLDLNKNGFQKLLETYHVTPSTNDPYVSDNSLPWFMQPDKLENLDKNIVYKNLKITRARIRRHVNIILIVSSAPSRIDRRYAIRKTWWEQCKSTYKISIKCVFLTDWKDSNGNNDVDLQLESDKYGDIHFQNLTGGYDFGKRFLYHMVWAMQNFKFDYFLRLDDDYFVCLERFLNEIPMPPKKLYHWGWVHCIQELVRPEESIILLSNDLIERFLGQDPEKMLCHRWADQMIGIWIKSIYLPGFYYKHDTRLHHHPPAMLVDYFKTEKNICRRFIGIHGSYPNDMMTLWQNRGDAYYNENKTLDDYSEYCMYSQYMNWDLFEGEWHATPMLCKEDPSWGGSLGTLYDGRQGQITQLNATIL